jgi:hypothetical protein
MSTLVGGATATRASIATLGGIGLLSTVAIGTVMALTRAGQRGLPWWRAARLLASMVTWPQWLALLLWAVVTGVLVAVGTWRHRFGPRLALGALIAGALVPVGLMIVARAMIRIWPGTTGPMDEPVLTLLLLAYSAVAPWALGRMMTLLP